MCNERFKDTMSGVRAAMIVAISAVVLGPFSQAQTGSGQQLQEKSGSKQTTISTSRVREFDDAIGQAAARTLPAIVQVSVSGFGPSREQQKGENVLQRQRGIGSGVIVDPSGYVITNAHVISGAQHIQVTLTSLTTELVPLKTSLLRRQRTFEAKVIGSYQPTDLALLKIEGHDLPFIPLKKENKTKLGQTVLALGSPQGLEHTVTKGVVSAVGRQPKLDQPMIYIQTDAPINPGNSGGALVDGEGNLLGINTFIYTQSGGSEGLGFAIPGPVVKFFYDEIRHHGHVRRTEVGASVQTITSALAAGLNLPQDWGVVVSDVTPGGPAEAAGLKQRDIVLTIDGRPTDSLPEFAALLFIHPQDQPVEMDVLRDGSTVKLFIPAVQSDAAMEKIASMIDPQNGLLPSLGVFVVDLDKSIADAIPGLRSSIGVLVAGKVDYAPAVEADLIAGDVVRGLNGRRVTGSDDLRTSLTRLKAGDPVVLEVERQGTFQYVTFEME